MSAKYRITITGLKPGGDENAARANLARLLKAPAEKIDRLLASVPVVIKKNVERELGEKYMQALLQAGVLVEIKPEGLELSLEPTEEKKSEESPQFACPQCGVAVQEEGKCAACLESTPSVQQDAAADKMARRSERNEQLKRSAIGLLISWIKGNIWKAAIVFILIPFFGGNLLLSSVFYTRDQHLVYQTLPVRTICVEDPGATYAMRTTAEQQLLKFFFDDFTYQERKQLLNQWNNVICRAVYEMELGNIGDETITANLEFATPHFVTGSKNPRFIVYQYFRDLSSSTPREQDPLVKQENGRVRLENIYPNTLVSLKFGGWVEGQDAAQDWPGTLAGINVDEGVVEVGNPLATAFGRLLTLFF